MNSLRITTIQGTLHWENIPANLKMFEDKLTPLRGKTDLIALPEMFTTGFTMSARNLAEQMDGPSLDWMKAKAKYCDAVITGSLIIKEKGNFYNRLIWMQPDGQFAKYDKRHLFGLAKEDEVYTAGNQKLIVEWKGWKICPLICYDLRFPVWARNVENYDLLIYVANWPETRVAAWSALLKARAIENQAYTIGVNRTGKDIFVNYTGESTVIEYSGNVLYQITEKEAVHTITLFKDKQENFRSKLSFLADQDAFEIK